MLVVETGKCVNILKLMICSRSDHSISTRGDKCDLASFVKLHMGNRQSGEWFDSKCLAQPARQVET